MKKLIIAALAFFAQCSPQPAWAFKVGGMTWVTGDGTASQCMKTDGAAHLGWTSVLTPTSPVDAANITGTLPIAHGGTNGTTQSGAFNNLSPMTTLGDIIYGGTSGTGTRLAGTIASSRRYFTQTGTGAVSAAPSWNTIASSDLPSITLTGDVTGSSTGGSIATTVAAIAGTTVSGVTGTGTTVVFSASPTLTGTAVVASLGASTNISSPAFTSSSSNTAAAGVLRLATANTIRWRNNANSADVALAKDTSDQLSWAGTSFLSSAGVLLAAGSPAYTGDVTKPSGSLTTTVAAIGGVAVGTPTGTTNAVFSNSPTLVTPALGTPTALVGTNISGTGASFTAGNVSTNHNMTGPITGTGNVTSITAQTGTGTTFAMSAGPTFSGTLASAAITASGIITGNASTNFFGTTADSGSAKTTVTIQGSTTAYNNAAGLVVNAGASSSNFNSVFGNAANNANFLVIDGGGGITMPQVTTGTNADFMCLTAGLKVTLQSSACTISSKRFKENIKYLEGKTGLDVILALRPVEFNMKKGETPNPDNNYARKQVGLIAEDVAAVEPKLAIYEQDGKTPKSYRQESVIAELVLAVQKQQAEIEDLKTKLAHISN